MIKQPTKLTFEIQLKFVNRTIRIHWLLLLLAVAFMYGFIRLGQWQMSRASEKASLIQTSQQRLSSKPQHLSHDSYKNVQDYQPVIFEGRHYKDVVVYVANETHHSRDGYHIYVPIELRSSSLLVWVNLGWIAALPDRRQLPEFKGVADKIATILHNNVSSKKMRKISIEGYGYFSKGRPLLFDHALTQYKENIWLLQGRDYELLFSVLSERKNDTLPYIIRSTKRSDDGLVRDWVIISMKPEKHIAYAVQWFGLAFLVGVLFILLSIKKMGIENGSE